jgi:Ca2+-binding EF-hand superfamily protein
MGGNGDATGEISARLLRETIHTFGLTVDIDQLIREADTDASGFIDYEEFRAMLRG